MQADCMPLVVGLAGTTLSDEDRETLERIHPAGVILFARNFATPEQTRDLVAAVQELEPRPFVCADLEGGMVNRLVALWGDLPAPAVAGAAGRRAVRALGEAAGAACRNLGIHLDLAPVVDLDCPDGCLGAQGRCFSDDPERVVTLASIFNEGLGTWGITGCAKHFPGLGPIQVDTHEKLPQLDVDSTEMDRHLAVFSELSLEIPVVMVAHVIVPGFGDGELPASLSRAVIERASNLPGSPVVLADDIEMGALEKWGDLPERVVAAIHARNHGVLICNAVDRLQEISDYLTSESSNDSTLDSRLTEMAARMGTLRRDLLQRAAAVPAPDDATVEQLWERARKEAAT